MVPATIQIAPPLPDSLTAVGIGGLAVVVVTIFVWLLSRGRPSAVAALVAIAVCAMAASALAAASGRLATFERVPPPMALMMASVIVLGLGTGLSPLGRDAAERVPTAAWVALQSFRLPLELLMHRAGTLGIMPPELSFGGYNFDILTGLGACLIGGAVLARIRVPTWMLWLWNVWGCWCLCVIAVVAVTASPMVRLFGDDPRHINTWVLYFPYVWLPVGLVTVAIASHVIITRALRRA